MTEPNDTLDPLERAALEAWEHPAAPVGFAERLVARAEAQTTPRRRWLPAASAGLVAIAVAGLSMARFGPATEGSRAAVARETIALGERAVAVLEADAEIVWRVEPSGATHVEQRRGSVFYRVEPGEAFVVATPDGEARALGTCFTLEVTTMQGMKQLGLGLLVGAMAGSATVLTLYEGAVDMKAANANEVLHVQPGERAMMGGGAAPQRIAAAPHPALAPSHAPTTLAEAQQEIARLEAALLDARRGGAALGQSEPTAVRKDAAAPRPREGGREELSYIPDQAELQEMAKNCEVRIDLPSGMFGRQPHELSEKRAADEGMDEETRQGMNRAITAMHKEIEAKVRDAYVAMTGDAEAAKWLSTQAMFEELKDKTSGDEQTLARQRIARERAGLVPVRQDSPPFEQYLRWFAGLGDNFEQKAAREIGADKARALRQANDGWNGSRHRMGGCPE